jgi:hypothetical protein
VILDFFISASCNENIDIDDNSKIIGSVIWKFEKREKTKEFLMLVNDIIQRRIDLIKLVINFEYSDERYEREIDLCQKEVKRKKETERMRKKWFLILSQPERELIQFEKSVVEMKKR